MHKDVEKILFDEKQISDMVERIGKQISDDFRDSDKKLLVV